MAELPSPYKLVEPDQLAGGEYGRINDVLTRPHGVKILPTAMRFDHTNT